MNMRILMVVLIGCMIAPGLTSAAIVTVDDSGGADYTTIWQALQNVVPFDTVWVYDGTYTGEAGNSNRITILDDDIMVVSDNLHGAVIENAYFRSEYDDSRISRFKGDHPGSVLPFAYMTATADNVLIKDCDITGAGVSKGINAWGDSITIENCTFSNVKIGVECRGDTVNIKECTFHDFVDTAQPILLTNCVSPVIEDNTFSNCAITLPIIAASTSTALTLHDNTFNNCNSTSSMVAISATSTSLTIGYTVFTSCTTPGAFISVVTAATAKIDDTWFINCVSSNPLFSITGAPHIEIDDAHINGCTASELFNIDDSEFAEISNVDIDNSAATVCFYVTDSESVIMQSIDIMNTVAGGMKFRDGTSPDILQCNFNGVGVHTSSIRNWCINAASVAHLKIVGCTFVDGCANAVYVSEGTSFSTIMTDNTFTGNGDGVNDAHAIYVASGAGISGYARDNTFNAGDYTLVHYGGAVNMEITNNIIDGSVYDSSKTGHASQTWNKTKPFVEQPNIIGGKYIAGNSWGDYEGWDSDNDGIGDVNVPHHHDHHPITNRWQIYDQTGVHGATTEMITDKWFAVAGAEVNMYNNEKSFIAYTDEHGHWVFTNTSHELTNGTYYITAKKDRYKTASPFTVNYTVGNVTFAEIKMERDTGQYYSRHEVTFLVCNMWKAPHEGVDVQVFIDGLLDQVAKTGTDGTVTFVMFVDVEYTIEFDNSIPIDPMVIRIQPHDSYYVIYTSRTQYSPDNENTYEGKVEWYWTARETPHGAWLNLTWVDYTHRATRLRAWANSTTSTFSTDIEVNTFTDYNVTIPLWVDNQHNNSYILHVETDHPDYPELAHSHFMPWSFIDRMVDFAGFSEDWQYATAAACILIFVALMFSGVSLSAGALVVVMLAWMFVWIEWISGTYLNYAMLVFATIIAVGYILKTKEHS